MHWITMSGITLIAAGTFLIFFGQNIRHMFDDKHLHYSISEKTFQIDELVNGNNKLLTRIDEYQKNLSGKDKIIQQLEVQINKSNVTDQEQVRDEQLGVQIDSPKAKVPRQVRDEQLELQFDRPKVIDPEPPADEQEEAVAQVISESGYSDLIAQAKDFCDEGKYDEAYKIADDLRRKDPDYGQAYFVLGTIEQRRKHYNKGEDLLNRAVSLEMPDKDMAWALHNLGISSVRKNNYEMAKVHLEKAIEFNPGMEKSRKALKLINDYLHKTEAMAQAKSLCEEGRDDEACKIADDIRQKDPDYGQAYFVLGTVELRKKNYSEGVDLLNKAVNLGLPDEDMAWALHNLGIFSLRMKDFVKAKDFLEKSIRFNPDMEESQKALDTLDNLQKKEKQGKNDSKSSKSIASGKGSKSSVGDKDSKGSVGGKGSKSSVSDKGSKSIVSDKGSKSVVSDKDSRSIASGKDSRSIASGKDSRSSVGGKGSKSIASDKGSKSIASDKVSKSIASDKGSKSIASDKGSKSIASDKVSKSIASGKGSKSITSDKGSKSIASSKVSKSIASGKGSKSITSGKGSKSRKNRSKKLS